jgi:hypothetical protein
MSVPDAERHRELEAENTRLKKLDPRGDVERAISGIGVARVLDRLAHSRGLRR